MLVKSLRAHTLVICQNPDTYSTDLYKWKYSQGSVGLVTSSVTPQNLYQTFYKHKFSVSETDYVGSRLTLLTCELDDRYKNISIYDENRLTKTVADVGYEMRFVATGSLIGSKYLTALNGQLIKKICSNSGKFKVIIFTADGKMHALDNFDSDIEYDLTDKQIVFPEGEVVTDIDCNHTEVIALTESGAIYKINLDAEEELPFLVPIRPFIEPLIAAISCQQYRTIYQSVDGQIYSDNISKQDENDETNDEINEINEIISNEKYIAKLNKLVKIEALSNIKVVCFECSNYSILALSEEGILYSVSIDEYGFEIDQSASEFSLRPVLTKFTHTKSARNV